MRSISACCCPGPKRSSSPPTSAGCCTGRKGGLIAGLLFILPGVGRDHGTEPGLCRLRQRRARSRLSSSASRRRCSPSCSTRCAGSASRALQQPRQCAPSPPPPSSPSSSSTVPFPLIVVAAASSAMPAAARGAAAFAGGAATAQGGDRGDRERPRRGAFPTMPGRTCAARSGSAPSSSSSGWRRSLLLLALLGPRQRLHRDRPVLLADGGRDLRRRLCGARLRRPAGGRYVSAGCSPARCSTASAWPRRRRGR